MGADTRRDSFFYKAAAGALRAASKAVHWLDSSSKLHPGWDPYMKHSFAPVDKEVLEGVEVIEGNLPEELEGTYVRTGPNPKLAPMGGYHWFDGDGMIHAVRIAGGRAIYCNRWVETARLEQEERAGFPLAGKIGDYRGFSSLVYMGLNRLAIALGVLSQKHGLGTANTAIAYHAGKLLQILALHEGDLPYALRVACSGLVETVGRVTYGGKVTHAFTAHPKLDPETQQLFYFGYDCGKAPHCHYGWLEADGTVAADFPVTIPKPVMMHDMALTQKHALILDMPLEFEPKVMVKEGKLPFVFADRPARIGVLPRCARSADDIRWFTAERLMSFHVANAWEEGKTIRLFLCTMNSFSLDEFTAAEGAEPLLTEFRLHLDTGACTVRRFEESPAAYGDFPVVHPGLVGRRTRYTYVACMESDDRGVPRFVGVTKFDLQSGTIAGHVRHGGARLGGEAVFVPRRPGPIAPGSEDEDDGWLMTYVTDDDTLHSELVVYDARTMAATPVVRLRMPQRVPHGFHGHWVTAAQLAAQAAA